MSFGSWTILGRWGSARNSASAAAIWPWSSRQAVRATPGCGESSKAATREPKPSVSRSLGFEREPDGDGLVARRGIQERAKRGGGIERGVVGRHGRDRGGGGQVAQERGEAEFGVEVAQSGVIGFAALDGFEIELDGRVGGDGGELLRERDLIFTIDQGFAVTLAFDLGGVGYGGFRRAETADQFARAFFADAFCAGDVVDGIAHERHHVGNFFRRHAHQFFYFCGVDDEIAFVRAAAGAQDEDASADELHHVLVAGDDVDVQVTRGGLARQRADYVIGFVAVDFDGGQAHGFAEAAHEGKLDRQDPRAWAGAGLCIR